MHNSTDYNFKNISSLKPIFIIGHPKSGTSLLNALLDSHPQLLVLPEETDYYSIIWPVARLLNLSWRISSDQKANTLLNLITTKSHLRNLYRGKVEKDISGNINYTNFPSSEFSKHLNEYFKNNLFFKRSTTLVNIFTCFFKASGTVFSNDLKYWVEKTPSNTWYVNRILRDFPESVFLFVYRDPRDNYISYKKKWEDHQNPIKFSKTWNETFEKASLIPEERIYEIKYEKLVRSTDEVINGLRDFLGLQETDSLLTPTKLGKLWYGNSMFDIQRKIVDNNSVGRYKSSINEYDRDVIERLCATTMEKRGYELSTVQSSLDRPALSEILYEYRRQPSKITSNFRLKLIGRSLKTLVTGRCSEC